MKKKLFNIIIILIASIISIMSIIGFSFSVYNYTTPLPLKYNDKIPYYDENNNKINNLLFEREEQFDAVNYINPNSTVLELGARYGTVSCPINYLLNNSKNHVVIEPDQKVLSALQKNKLNHNSEFQIFEGIISDTPKIIVKKGYGTTVIDKTPDTEGVDVKTLSYNDFKNKYNLNFNVLVADCEGCLEDFFDYIGPTEIRKFNTILFEKDYPSICNYKKIEKLLENNGFLKIKDGFHVVYVMINK